MEPSYTPGGNAGWQFLKWINMELPYDPCGLELCTIKCTDLKCQWISPKNEYAPATNTTSKHCPHPTKFSHAPFPANPRHEILEVTTILISSSIE